MSRRFLDDNVEVKLVLNNGVGFDHLPVVTNQYYDPGHMCLDPISGKRFNNENPPERPGSLFVNDQYNALILHERFEVLPSANGTGNAAFNANGTNVANSTIAFAVDGGVTFTTAATANNSVILEAGTNSIWGSVSLIANNSIVFETQIVTAANITAAIIWAGLKLTSTSANSTDANQTFVRYQDTINSGKFQVIDSTSNVDTIQDSGVTVAASTAYLIQIKVDENRVPHYLINGILIGSGTALVAGVAFKPFIGVQTTASAAKAFTVRSARIVLPRTPFAA